VSAKRREDEPPAEPDPAEPEEPQASLGEHDVLPEAAAEGADGRAE
jgi:hypothetical protein